MMNNPTISMAYDIHLQLGSRSMCSLGPVGMAGLAPGGGWGSSGAYASHTGGQICKEEGQTTQAHSKHLLGCGICDFN